MLYIFERRAFKRFFEGCLCYEIHHDHRKDFVEAKSQIDKKIQEPIMAASEEIAAMTGRDALLENSYRLPHHIFAAFRKQP